MRFTVAAVALAGTMAFGAFSARGTVAAQGVKSQWDGIYTEAQAKRGEAVYAERCSTCHAADMSGAEMAPSLFGGEFSGNWNDLSVNDLFERIRVSMPQDAPGSLSRQQVADIVSAMLAKGQAPAGATELPTQAEVLTGIKFLSTKP